ncbi:MAG: hypothetical protein WAM14_20740 [Candidatus Nitrosopolaris sp.]
MVTKAKPKGKKKGKLKPAKRSGATLKRKSSKGQSTSRPSNRGTNVTGTKKISRRPKKSNRSSKPVPRKERSTVVENTPLSSGPTTTVYESQEVTAFDSPIDEHDENETITTSTVSSSDENNENSNGSTLLD